MERRVLTTESREAIMRAFLENVCFPIVTRKGKASAAGGTDPNQGFFDAASPDNGVDHHVVWWVYFIKQVLRFKTWIFKKTFAEPPTEMLADMINYLLIEVSLLVADGKMDFEGNPYSVNSIAHDRLLCRLARSPAEDIEKTD